MLSTRSGPCVSKPACEMGRTVYDMSHVKNISNWPDPVGQKMDMTQNCSLLLHKGYFPGKSKNNETTQICLKYSLTCPGASILERCLENNYRLSPKTMVPIQ